MSERRACKLLEQPQSSQRYKRASTDHERPLVKRMLVLAKKYTRYGYRTITRILRKEGWIQDLDGFSLEDYKPFANVEAGFDRVVQFLCGAISENGQQVKWLDTKTFSILSLDGSSEVTFTTDRELAREQEGLTLVGLDHPLMLDALKRWQGLDPERRGVAVDGNDGPAVVS